jgi:hypothetical protein
MPFCPPELLSVSPLKNKCWKNQSDTRFFLFPSVILFYNGLEIPYKNIFSRDRKAAPKALGKDYEVWHVENKVARRDNSEIMYGIDSSSQRPISTSTSCLSSRGGYLLATSPVLTFLSLT